MSFFFEILVRLASYGPQIDQLHGENRLSHIINVFTFGGAKRRGSDRECKYFPIGMNAREPLWR